MAEGEANDKPNLNQGVPVEPGTVVAPGGQAPEQNTPIIKMDPDDPAQPGSVVAPAEPAAQAPVATPAEPAAALLPQPEPASAALPDDIPDNPASGSITWTASEFVAHDKTSGWYLALIGVAVLAAAVVYLITKDFVSVAVVIVAAALFGVFGARKPRQLDFRLDQHGVSVGPKSYSYQEFRYFSVVPEGAFSSIVFMPLKRFAPPLTIYYAPEDEAKILALLNDRLPYEPEHRDAIDSLMRRVRF